MKKLLIALASAAAITGAAKAAGSGVGHTTTFEALQIGSAFNAALDDDGTGTGGKYWAIAEGADENYATVTNATFKDSAGAKEGSSKALAIDTSARLSRQVNPGSEGAESFASTSLYFDGYVQFTAADSLPTTETGDKLVVWLYGGDEDADDAVAAALGLENKASTNLVITAATLDGNYDPTPTNFVVSGVSVLPDQWKRLTIKAFVENNLPKFKVYIDGTQVSSGDTSVFNSLVKAGQSGATTLTSVSFEGTGAVDDLGFTAVDLFPDAVAETFTLTVTAENGTVALYDANAEPIEGSSPWTIPLAQTMLVAFSPESGYTIDSATFGGTSISVPEFNTDADAYIFELDVSTAQSGDTLALVITTSGGEPAETVSVTVTGGENATATWTVNGNTVNAPASLTVGDTYQVTFAANQGYEFAQGATTTFSGTATSGQNITIMAPNATQTQQQGWPTGSDLNALEGQTVAAAYGLSGNLANVDAKVFTTWAAGVGNVAFTDKATTTYNVDCFLLNIANASTTEQIAAAKETAAEAIKITAITFDDDGKPVLTAPATYGNGKVVIKGSATLPVESWHDQIDGDHFFRSELVVDAVPEN